VKTKRFTICHLRFAVCDSNDAQPATRNPRHTRPLFAFTLIEIMITVGLLSFIVLGLLAMFNQTQRAFRTSMTQSDVLEAGRATMDLIGRELTQMGPSQAPDMFINNAWYRATNFFSEGNAFFANPLLQTLPGMATNILRTNSIQRLFFISRLNQDWLGTGYEVLPDDNNGIVGTLYRFYRTNTPRSGLISLSGNFIAATRNALLNTSAGQPVTNLSRIADGIVHFRVQAYAQNGFLIVTNSARATNAFAVVPNGPQPYYTNAWNTIACATPFNRAQTATYFMSNAIPAYVDIELGILEPQILQRYRSIPIAAVQRQYLADHVAQVHLFRQRVAIPNVDTTAYP